MCFRGTKRSCDNGDPSTPHLGNRARTHSDSMSSQNHHRAGNLDDCNSEVITGDQKEANLLARPTFQSASCSNGEYTRVPRTSGANMDVVGREKSPSSRGRHDERWKEKCDGLIAAATGSYTSRLIHVTDADQNMSITVAPWPCQSRSLVGELCTRGAEP